MIAEKWPRTIAHFIFLGSRSIGAHPLNGGIQLINELLDELYLVTVRFKNVVFDVKLVRIELWGFDNVHFLNLLRRSLLPVLYSVTSPRRAWLAESKLFCRDEISLKSPS